MKYLWNQIYIIQFIVYFLVWKINIPAKVMLLLQYLKNMVFFEFVKQIISEFTDRLECEDLDAVACTVCKINKGVASRVQRLDD